MNQIPPDFQLNALRFGVGVLFSLIYLFSKWVSPLISKESIKWLAIVSATTIIFNFTLYSHYLKRMPIVTVLCVHQTFKIILTLIFAKLFLNSNISIAKCVLCLATVVGTVLTVVPRVQMYLDLPTSELEHISLENNNGTNLNEKGKCAEKSTINNTHSHGGYDEHDNGNNHSEKLHQLFNGGCWSDSCRFHFFYRRANCDIWISNKTRKYCYLLLLVFHHWSNIFRDNYVYI